VKLVLAYITVVLIWSTTPLAIKWSSHGLSFLSALALRMSLATILCWTLLLLSRKRLIHHRADWKSLFAGALGMFPSMILMYWAAQFIPSGLAAVIFGAYPFLVGVFSALLLRENPFNATRIVALTSAFFGLYLVHWDGGHQLSGNALWGVLIMIFSATVFAFATVVLKKVGGGIEPLRQLTGALTIATPGFVLVWWLCDGQIPANVDSKSALSVLYLVMAGSLVGGVLFYYVLHRCSVSTTSLIPLISPVMAVSIGYFFAGEVLSREALIGAALILLSLAIYQGLLMRLLAQLKRLGKSVVVLKRPTPGGVIWKRSGTQ